MPTIGGAQRELDTHVQNAETLSPARRNPTPRHGAVARARMPPATPAARRVGSSLITSIPTRHPIGPVSSVRLRAAPPALRWISRERETIGSSGEPQLVGEGAEEGCSAVHDDAGFRDEGGQIFQPPRNWGRLAGARSLFCFCVWISLDLLSDSGDESSLNHWEDHWECDVSDKMRAMERAIDWRWRHP